MIKAEIILDTRRKTKKGFPVKIRAYDTDVQKHEYVSLKMYQSGNKLRYDNLLKQRDYELVHELEFINSKKISLKEALEIFKKGLPQSDIEKRIIELESELASLKSQISPTMLFEFVEIYKKEKVLRKESFKIQEALITNFKQFLAPQKDIAINDLTFELLNDFQGFLLDKISPISVKTYFSKFNTIFREAQKREQLHIKEKNPFTNIKLKRVLDDTDKSISIETLIKLNNLSDAELSLFINQANIKRTVDLFLFQFVIGGHDFIDIGQLKWSNLENGRVKFRRYKNRSKNNGGALVDNKLFPFALDIIEKYGTKDKERVFDFIPALDYETKDKKYQSFIINFNLNLNSIRKKLGIKEVLLSKRTRYTFNTIAGNLLINRDIIEQIQGHTQSSISFGYYGGTQNEIKDKEHQKVIDAVFTTNYL